MILDNFIRPIELFDVNNKKHRQYYAEYLKTNTWGNCPVQLKVPKQIVSLSTYAREQLIQYYIDKEFGKNYD
jgi:hypothetical protein